MNFFQWVTLTAHLVSPATIIVIVIILVNAPLHTQNTWKVLYCACLCLCVRGPVQQNTDRERERPERQRWRERERDRQAGGSVGGGGGRGHPAKQSNHSNSETASQLSSAAACCVLLVFVLLQVCVCVAVALVRSLVVRCFWLGVLSVSFELSYRADVWRRNENDRGLFSSSSLVLFIVVSVYVHWISALSLLFIILYQSGSNLHGVWRYKFSGLGQKLILSYEISPVCTSCVHAQVCVQWGTKTRRNSSALSDRRWKSLGGEPENINISQHKSWAENTCALKQKESISKCVYVFGCVCWCLIAQLSAHCDGRAVLWRVLQLIVGECQPIKARRWLIKGWSVKCIAKI